jgi:hypothetical protein
MGGTITLVVPTMSFYGGDMSPCPHHVTRPLVTVISTASKLVEVIQVSNLHLSLGHPVRENQTVFLELEYLSR